MTLNKRKHNKDGIIWRYKKNWNNKHDNKANIRKLSLIENSKLDMRIIYFIIFLNFIESYSINQAFKNGKKFCNQLKIESVSRKAIRKFII